ncbi:MAG: ATP-binding cassette domain-containing protein [Candidatus Dormiibacterota bacterium]
MIQARNLTKRYGDTLAVDGLTFEVKPGQVTGFLGPNGAGKSTTLRMMLGLDSPTSGTVTVDGHPYSGFLRPLRQVGALLDAGAVQASRSAYNHLLGLAQSNGLPKDRVDAVLELVGMTSVAKQRMGVFSLGMSQRIGIAASLLGDPGTLLFDEPVNGLDPEGIVWFRKLARSLAAEGRTVFVSSHLMSEMALTADHLIVIGQGRLLADAPLEQVIGANAHGFVRVRSPQLDALTQLLTARGATVSPEPDGAATVTGIECAAVGDLSAANGIVLHELSLQRASLEEAFMDLTETAVDFRSSANESSTPVTAGDPR